LEAFKAAGKAKAIGVSHYCKQHIEDIMEVNTTVISINQVQYHIGMGSAVPGATDDKDWMFSHGITYQAFSSLCGPCNDTELITGDLTNSIGQKYGKTGAQVALKWVVQQGIPVIPKSDNPVHLQQNIDLFDWELSADDMNTLTKQTKPSVDGGDTVSGDCTVA
jgi:diketogulonate reductase-like aldo/keto reductase